MIRKLAYFLICALLFGMAVQGQNDSNLSTTDVAKDSVLNKLIRTKGLTLVDSTNSPIKLRGVILEGWLQWNGTLWGAGLVSETTILNRLKTLVGDKEVENFQKEIYKTFIREDDIKKISELGFNVVRIPFNHTILEDDSHPYKYKESGWELLDNILAWCEKHKVYAVLDFHSVPGGQSGVFVADPDLIKLWDSEENINRTVALWVTIAERYKGRSIVAGYDLINEPGPPNHEALIDVYKKIIHAVRKVDPDHMIILEGGEFASTDFSMFDGPLCVNQVLSFHTYNLFGNKVNKDELQQISDLSKRLGIPVWNGEFGAHSEAWLDGTITIFEKPENHINGWIFWPWKRVSEWNVKRYRNLMEIKSTQSWDKVRTYCGSLFGWGQKPSREETLKGMKEFVEAIKTENLVLDKGTLKVLDRHLNKGLQRVDNQKN